MSLSKIVVSGKVSRAPEKRFTPNTNVTVTEFSIAVESPPRADGTQEASFVKVICWRELAERCFSEVKKGDVVIVDGRLQIESYTSPEGQRKRQAEIEATNVENVSLLGSGQANVVSQETPHLAKAGAKASKPAADDLDAIFASEDEIPF